MRIESFYLTVKHEVRVTNKSSRTINKVELIDFILQFLQNKVHM